MEGGNINRLDLLCENENKELIIIVVRVYWQHAYFERRLLKATKLSNKHPKAGDPYRRMRKVLSMHILHFDLGQISAYLCHRPMRFVGSYTRRNLLLTSQQ